MQKNGRSFHELCCVCLRMCVHESNCVKFTNNALLRNTVSVIVQKNDNSWRDDNVDINFSLCKALIPITMIYEAGCSSSEAGVSGSSSLYIFSA